MSEFANWLITLMNYPVCMMITHRAHNIFCQNWQLLVECVAW